MSSRLTLAAKAAFLTLFTFLPVLAAADEVEARPTYWHDGQRRVPLVDASDAGTPERRAGMPASRFRASPGGRLLENDGRFYVCYPEDWEESRIAELEAHYGLRHEALPGQPPTVRHYRERDAQRALSQANRIFEENRLPCAAPLWKQRRVAKKSLVPDDPLFPLQWYLHNTGQCTGVAGEDISAVEAWGETLGEGTVVAVVDDGLEIDHPDLAQNLLRAGHYDFIDNDTDPTAGDHGTAVAGIAAGRGFNGIGLAGTAPAASLLGLRILPENGEWIDEADEAAALGYNAIPVAVYNNSWGPADGSLNAFDGPSPLVRAAQERRIREGRGGLGSIYVWAAGNGGVADDSNLDGYANSRYAIAVTATTCAGMAASYAESGSNILLSAPSGDGLDGLVTTDRTGGDGYNTGAEAGELFDRDYSNSFIGTSAAVPVVAGTVAMMLAVNDHLGWRDVRQILALSADYNDPAHPWWRFNGAGLAVNEQYGFGRVNAGRAVKLADSWLEPLAAEQTASYGKTVNLPIPDNDYRGVTDRVTVTDALRIESVMVTVDIPDHTYWGDIAIYLTSPAGTRVRLVQDHYIDERARELGFRQWTLHDALHLGEDSRGNWTIEVSDNVGSDVGTFVSWQLTIYGTRIPDRLESLPVACPAVPLSRPGATSPGRVFMGVGRHGAAYRGATAGTSLEDYRLLTGIASGVPVAEQLAVASYEGPDGATGWFMLTERGWKGWDGRASSLDGFANPAGSVATVHAGRLLPGRYQVWSGYRDNGEIYACPEPLRITIAE